MKKLIPRNAKTFSQICKLKYDNVDTKNSWILIDEGVIHIYNQKSGEEPTGNITLTRREFNRFVDWYNGR